METFGTWRGRSALYGMLCCGYAAGQHHPDDWMHLPWWIELAIGVAFIAVAFIAAWRHESERERHAAARR
jgi:hypothetical protein